MDERDKAMFERAAAYGREREKHTLCDPKSELDAARWLLADESGGWHGRRVEYLLSGRDPYQLGLPDLTDPMAMLTLHVCEHDVLLMVASRWTPGGLAIWREGITTMQECDMRVSMHERRAAEEGLAEQIGRWIAEVRAEQVSEAHRRAARRNGEG